MRKLLSIMLIVLGLCSFTVMADDASEMASALTTGGLIVGSPNANFTYSADSKVYVLRVNRALKMYTLVVSSGAKVTIMGPVTVKTNGTELRMGNPNLSKTNWMGLKLYTGGQGYYTSSTNHLTTYTTNVRFWVPTGTVALPSKVLFPARTTNYLIKVENTHTTNAAMGLNLFFWQ